MKTWISRVKELLRESLSPVPHELNALDWKLALSEKSERFAQHLTAFANHPGGGYFVFGIDSLGAIQGIDRKEAGEIIHKIANISRDSVEPPQKVDHFIDKWSGVNLLFIQVPESTEKPVHLRGKGIEHSYTRSGGQTRKMSRQEIANSVLHSQKIRYEELEASQADVSTILKELNHEKVFELLKIPSIGTSEAIIDQLVNNKMVYRKIGGLSITNLGVITAAQVFSRFHGKERFTVRVIKYRGTSRMETQVEKEFPGGYATSFQNLIRYIMDQLPSSEIIKDALRKDVAVYPEITIRELVANAMIHRDFSISTTHLMIEIFHDRIEIINPGTLLPNITIERIIDAAPESRNEILASFMRRAGICEERGSGIDKALFAVEFYGLPPIEFINGPNIFKAIIYSPKGFKKMSQKERLQACYQHCCLKYVSGERMTNATIRKRLGLKDSQYTVAWKILDHAVGKGMIKPYEADKKSKKYASYVPFWA